jgi:hypothetical protein
MVGASYGTRIYIMVYIENFEFRVSLACMTYVLLINSEAEPTSSALLSRKSLSLRHHIFAPLL